MSFGFLSVAAGSSAIARSPMERQAAAAGARFELRGGWNVAVAYAGEDRAAGGWADVSQLRIDEFHGALPLAVEEGGAARSEGAWWCPMTRERALVIGGSGPLGRVQDMTSCYAGLVICGPHARDVLARFTAIDVRERSLPVGGLRPGSVARTPGLVLRESEDRFLMLFGWAFGEYMWTVVEDAARPFGGGPLGADALEELPADA